MEGGLSSKEGKAAMAENLASRILSELPKGTNIPSEVIRAIREAAHAGGDENMLRKVLNAQLNDSGGPFTG